MSHIKTQNTQTYIHAYYNSDNMYMEKESQFSKFPVMEFFWNLHTISKILKINESTCLPGCQQAGILLGYGV